MIHFDNLGKPRVWYRPHLTKHSWGFNANEIRKRAMRVGWKDLDLIDSLLYGFKDWSHNTLPISAASPHQKKVQDHRTEFQELIEKEIQRGWFTDASKWPNMLPFRMAPGNIEPKKTIGKFRLLWNLSWPKPGSHDSIITDGVSMYPVATNFCTSLPPFMKFEWTEIHTNKQVIHVLAELADVLQEPILSWPIDFTDWFRQIAIDPDEYWKSIVLTPGGCRTDTRMQMGRCSSAHHGQRLSFLLAELVMHTTAEEGWEQEGLSRIQILRLNRWKERRRVLGPRQDRVIIVVPFQDDLTCYVVGRKAAEVASKRSRVLIERDLGLELSEKEEANKPPSTSFTSIGALYDTSDIHNITARPSEVVVQKLKDLAHKARQKKGGILSLEVAQQWAGFMQFVAGFVIDGRFLCNSIYSSLSASRHIKSKFQSIRVTEEICQDIDALIELSAGTPGPPLIDENKCWDGGAWGIRTDAAAPAHVDGRGWGVVVGKVYSRGQWSSRVCQAVRDKRVSINQLELITMVAGLEIAAREGAIPRDGSRVVVRGDNLAAIAAINRWRADSAGMKAGLRAAIEACRRWNVRIWGVHLPGKDNTEADGLSRSSDYGTVLKKGGYTWTSEPEEMDTWIEGILQSSTYELRDGEEEVGLLPDIQGAEGGFKIETS